MKLELYRKMSQWELKRETRQVLEEKYKNFTGHIDVIECHIPYTNFNGIQCMFDKTARMKGKKLLVIAGDFLNLDLFGPFLATSEDVSLPSDEIAMGKYLLKEASKIYDQELFLISNHDNRIYKVIRRNIDDPRIQSEVKMLMDGYDKIFKEIQHFDIADNYLFQIGNVLVTHLESNSGVPGKIDRDLVQYLGPRIKKPWDIVFQAHTHSQSRIPIDRKLCIETGALVDSLDYWVRGKMSGKGKFGTMGHGICEMNKGKADMNDCNFIITDWQGYI